MYGFAALVLLSLFALTCVIIYSYFSLNAPPVPNLEKYANVAPGV